MSLIIDNDLKKNFDNDIEYIKINIEYFLKQFKQIENMKINYILKNNINVLKFFLKNNYVDIVFKVDKRKYTKTKFEKEKKQVLNIINKKKTVKFLNKEDKIIIYSFLQNIHIKNSYFEKNCPILPFLKIQKNITDICIISFYKLINSIINSKISIYYVRNNQDNLYIALVEKLIESVIKFDTNYSNKFITYVHNRFKMIITDFNKEQFNLMKINGNIQIEDTKIYYKDINLDDIYDIKENIYNNLNIFKLFNIKLEDEYNYLEVKTVIVKLFNAIIKNINTLIINNKTYKLEKPRNVFFEEIKTLYPIEFMQYNTNNKNLSAKKFINYLFLNKPIENKIEKSDKSKKETLNQSIQMVDDNNDELIEIENEEFIENFENFLGNELLKEKITEIIKNNIDNTVFEKKIDIEKDFTEPKNNTKTFNDIKKMLDYIVCSKEENLILLNYLLINYERFENYFKLHNNLSTIFEEETFKNLFFNKKKTFPFVLKVKKIFNEEIDKIPLNERKKISVIYLKFKEKKING